MDTHSIPPCSAVEAAGRPPGGVVVLRGDAAARRAARYRVPDSDEYELAVIFREFGGWQRWFVAGALAALGTALPVSMAYLLYSVAGSWELMRYAILKIAGTALGFFFLSSIMIILPLAMFSLAMGTFRDGSMVFVGNRTIFRRLHRGISVSGEAIPRQNIYGVEWIRMGSNGIFETNLLATEESREFVVAKGNTKGTLWMARFLGNLAGLPVTGNIPVPPVGDKKALANTANQYPTGTEIVRQGEEGFPSAPASAPSPALTLSSLENMAGSRVIADVLDDVPAGDSRGLVCSLDLRNARKACLFLVLLLFTIYIMHNVWTDPFPKPMAILHKCVFPPIALIVFVVFLHFVTGKIWLILLPDRLVRKREWCRLLLPETLSRSDLIGIEMFRAVYGKGWEVKARCGGEKSKTFEIADLETMSDALWIASTLHTWSGAPILERPNQRAATPNQSRDTI